jgi:hypothetical protein
MRLSGHILGMGAALWAGALCCALALGAAPKPEDPAAQAQAASASILAMPPAEQRAWREQFLERWACAARLTLDPDEARREQDRAAALLKQPPGSRRPGTEQRLHMAGETLAQLLGQLDRREKAAISRLVRQYRLLVQESFRSQPAGLVERREAWFRAWSRWEAAGRLPEEQDRLIAWLEAAIRRSEPGSIGPLPRDPTFGPAPAVVAAKVPPPAAVPLEPPPLPVRLPEPSFAALRLHEARKAAALVHRVSVPVEETWPAAPPLVALAAKPKGLLPTRTDQEPGTELRKGTLVLPPRQNLNGSQWAAMLPDKAEEPASTVQAAVSSGQKTAGTDLSQQPPMRPARTPSSHKSAGEDVQVDIKGLAARIAGVNLALRALEGDLEEKHEWNAEQLHAALSRLDILILRQKDLGLFRDLVPPAERGKAGTLESPRQALAALAARIAEARSRLGGPQADGSDAGRRAALDRLDEISDRLAALASEK